MKQEALQEHGKSSSSSKTLLKLYYFEILSRSQVWQALRNYEVTETLSESRRQNFERIPTIREDL